MSASSTLNCLKITLLLVYLDANIGWNFSVRIKKNGVDRQFSFFFLNEITLKKAAFYLMLLKALMQMLITGLKMH